MGSCSCPIDAAKRLHVRI
ncbi:unnamed protein product [Spirodela intermedia]|uniref:Uncharacterized protein n=1 Tax=Spirodela intermedia TaxID=51605 RepID=A0A7I8JU94_SPIIN|nr:unnamed protein product [Spirodela intermedia]CAA6673758.1 unnamed protein product [Spirodela intermedia]